MQRFFRPEDISAQRGYAAGFWDLYASSEQEEVDVGGVQYKCQTQRSGSLGGEVSLQMKSSLMSSCSAMSSCRFLTRAWMLQQEQIVMHAKNRTVLPLNAYYTS